jgi:hypothetical protein
VKVVRITLRTSFFTKFCTPRTEKLFEIRNFDVGPKGRAAAEKSPNRAGATPLFVLETAQNALGSLPPYRALRCARDFSAARNGFRNPERKNAMPLIKKAPALVSLEVKIEEPVKQLLEDYARFIDSTPDHVVNIVIKKNLWRDQDYRKWREQRRTSSQGIGKEAPAAKG